MNELFLYDQEKGLFKQILQQSKVMEGRYFVLTSGFDINNANLSEITGQKYPCAALVTPKSSLIPPDYMNEPFVFEMYFLTKGTITGDNNIMDVNPDTLISQHPAWYSWKDMKECAAGFLYRLRQTIQLLYLNDVPLKALVSLDTKNNPPVQRISGVGNDKLSGVKIIFNMVLAGGCENNDYDGSSATDINIPDLNIHPLHKH